MSSIKADNKGRVGQFLYEELTAGESISAGDAVAVDHQNNDDVIKASAQNFDPKLNFVGFAVESASSGDSILVNPLPMSFENGSLSSGNTYYLTDTAGDIGTTPGTHKIPIGKAVSSSKISRLPQHVAGEFISFNNNQQYTAPCNGVITVVGEFSTDGQKLTVNGEQFGYNDAGDISFTVYVKAGDTFKANQDTEGFDKRVFRPKLF